MEALAYLIPVALLLGLGGLGAFFWAMKSGQFEDLEGAGMRILIDDDDAMGHQNLPVDDPEESKNDETNLKLNVDQK